MACSATSARSASSVGATAPGAVARSAAAMHRAFHLEREYVATNLCPCAGCKEAANLTLKFVAHVGEVATQTIRDRLKLVGIDVIFGAIPLLGDLLDAGYKANLRNLALLERHAA